MKFIKTEMILDLARNDRYPRDSGARPCSGSLIQMMKKPSRPWLNC
jgi:hypothetical protein